MSKSEQHTGWRVGKGAFDGFGYTIYSGPEINGGGCYEAHIPGDATMPAVLHRAKLIAAAPDLLAALQNACNVLAGLAVGDLKAIQRESAALAQARAAIARATGEAEWADS